MSKLTISDLAINSADESLVNELTEQEVNAIFGGKVNVEIKITITIRF
ncbi:hypothetical protein [Nostoc sp. FACHB-110]|nr:hypothetical protein [Nostoc sp. FACHB-110]MBD2435382.1 hypothetical protein [Nostoc sp. FACHB-110]